MKIDVSEYEERINSIKCCKKPTEMRKTIFLLGFGNMNVMGDLSKNQFRV